MGDTAADLESPKIWIRLSHKESGFTVVTVVDVGRPGDCCVPSEGRITTDK
jgi:hypothetical protein